MLAGAGTSATASAVRSPIPTRSNLAPTRSAAERRRRRARRSTACPPRSRRRGTGRGGTASVLRRRSNSGELRDARRAVDGLRTIHALHQGPSPICGSWGVRQGGEAGAEHRLPPVRARRVERLVRFNQTRREHRPRDAGRGSDGELRPEPRAPGGVDRGAVWTAASGR